jgi:protein-S-isoprenylcysteine O-methyltransferase Ste14
VPSKKEAPNRRVEPVPESYDSLEVFDPESTSRPALAVWLLIGPTLSALGGLGLLRMLSGVSRSERLTFSVSSLLLDLLLLLVFIGSHTALARGWGRRWLNRPFGPGAERPLYVLVTGITLFAMTFFWQDTGPLVWKWNSWTSVLPRLVQIPGLILVVWSAIVVGPGMLIGLPHIRALENGRATPKQEFVALPPYSLLRQPLNLGILMLLVGMPEMTVDRLMLLVVMTAWILLVAPIEERDAELEFGEGYAVYRARTPRWLPTWRPGDK